MKRSGAVGRGCLENPETDMGLYFALHEALFITRRSLYWPARAQRVRNQVFGRTYIQNALARGAHTEVVFPSNKIVSWLTRLPSAGVREEEDEGENITIKFLRKRGFTLATKRERCRAP